MASIVVVEIKRPMRNDTAEGEDKDPIEQALGFGSDELYKEGFGGSMFSIGAGPTIAKQEFMEIAIIDYSGYEQKFDSYDGLLYECRY